MKIRQNIIFFALLACKALFYYKLLDTEHYFLITALTTVFYMMLLYLLCGSAKYTFIILNFIVSLFMFTNILYNRYFHALFSINTIFQAGQLKEVGGIVLDLIELSDFMLFIDPVLMLAIVLFMKKAQTYAFISEKHSILIRSVLFFMFIGALSFTAVNPSDIRLISAIGHQEIFSWYAKNGFDSFEKNDDQIVEIEPATPDQLSDKGYLHGTAAGRNLIVIQVESLQNMLINRTYNGQEITPCLNSLIAGESIYFSGYYQQLGKGNTSDAEFVTNNSLYPVIYGYAYDLFQNNTFHGLPFVLKETGYNTIALHGYKKSFWNREKAYPGQGFDTFIGEEDLTVDEKFGFGLSDESFFRQATEYLRNLRQPFYSFIVTLSSHKPFRIPAHLQGIELLPGDRDTLFGDYLQAIHYADREIGDFIASLRENGLYENSMIVLYGDHYGIDCKSDDAEHARSFLGVREYTYDMMMNVPLIINIPGSGINKTIDTVGGQIDFMPTVLNLLGIAGDGLVMFGQDLLNAESGFVASQTYMIKGSYIDDQVVFEMARTGIYEDSRAWDRKTHEPVDIGRCREGYERAVKEIEKSTRILENDALKDFKPGDGYSAGSAGSEGSSLHRTIFDLGSLDGTNWSAAFDTAYDNGHRLFQTDMTPDGQDKMIVSAGVPMENLVAWLEGHPDSAVTVPVTDRSFDALKIMEKQYPGIRSRIIPQIKDMGYYVKLEYRGYRKIILDIRDIESDIKKLSAYLDRNKISGAILSEEQYADAGLLDIFNTRGITVYNEKTDIISRDSK